MGGEENRPPTARTGGIKCQKLVGASRRCQQRKASRRGRPDRQRKASRRRWGRSDQQRKASRRKDGPVALCASSYRCASSLVLWREARVREGFRKSKKTDRKALTQEEAAMRHEESKGRASVTARRRQSQAGVKGYVSRNAATHESGVASDARDVCQSRLHFTVVRLHS